MRLKRDGDYSDEEEVLLNLNCTLNGPVWAAEEEEEDTRPLCVDSAADG